MDWGQILGIGSLVLLVVALAVLYLARPSADRMRRRR